MEDTVKNVELLKAEVFLLREALETVREDICRGPIDDTLWRHNSPSETTVDFISSTLEDGWDYDDWLESRYPSPVE